MRDNQEFNSKLEEKVTSSVASNEKVAEANTSKESTNTKLKSDPFILKETTTTVETLVTIPTVVPTVYPTVGDKLGVIPEVLQILAIEGGITKYGAVAQSNLIWSYAKMCLNAIDTKERVAILIYTDRNNSYPRAVLIPKASYDLLLTGDYFTANINAIDVYTKRTSWFINCACHGLSTLGLTKIIMIAPEVVTDITSKSVDVTTGTATAVLMSWELFQLANKKTTTTTT